MSNLPKETTFMSFIAKEYLKIFRNFALKKYYEQQDRNKVIIEYLFCLDFD